MSLQRLQGGMSWDLLARTVINSAINSIDNAMTWLATLLAYETNAYLEGTFTPAVTFGGGSTGLTYTAQGGTYTRVGRLVHVQLVILLSAKGSSTGTALITGLPLTVSQATPLSLQIDAMTAGVGDTHVQAVCNGGATTIGLSDMAAGAATALSDVDFTNTSLLRVNGTYITSA
jgi:hypothetical protein